MSSLLEVKDLSVTFHAYPKEVYPVRGVSFGVDAGEPVALVGESGCGKSVTSRCIMGLVNPPYGEIAPESSIRFDGTELLGQSPREWRSFRGKGCSIVFQDSLSALNPTLTIGRQVAEKIMVHEHISRRQALEKAEELLAMMKIPAPRQRMREYPHQFSGGQRQRVMIAIALACNPKMLIADEPTTALDVTIQADLLNLLKDMQQRMHMAILLITHDLGVVADMARRVLVMYAGNIVESGTTAAILHTPKHPYTQALLRSVPRLGGQRPDKLAYIRGMPLDLHYLPQGCPFCPRCPYAMRVCQRLPPPVCEFEEHHQARCWRYYQQGNGS